VRAHLHLISRLAYALRDPAFRETIQHRGLRDEILQAAQNVEAGLLKGKPSNPRVE